MSTAASSPFILRPESEWVSPSITVLDNGRPITFSIRNVLDYHGYDAVGGCVLGFRLLQRALALLSPNELPERRQLELFTNFPGLGARDAFELVGRVVTGNRFTLDKDFVDPRTPAGVTGGVYFRFSYGDRVVELAPIEGQPSPRFIAAGRASKKPDANEAVFHEWKTVKYELANLLLGADAAAVIRVL